MTREDFVTFCTNLGISKSDAESLADRYLTGKCDPRLDPCYSFKKKGV